MSILNIDDRVLINKSITFSAGGSGIIISSAYLARVAFRNWQIHVYPVVQETTKHTWAVTTINRTSTPRYVILAFQTNHEGDFETDMGKFDHCSFQNIRVYLSNERSSSLGAVFVPKFGYHQS